MTILSGIVLRIYERNTEIYYQKCSWYNQNRNLAVVFEGDGEEAIVFRNLKCYYELPGVQKYAHSV